MKEIKIREATLQDLECIQKLNRHLFEYEYQGWDSNLKVDWPYTKEGTKYFTDTLENQIIFVACDEEQVVGYLAGSLNIKPSFVLQPYAELDNISILEQYQRYGIGTKLITQFKEYCYEHEIFEIRVTANASNRKALKFYQKNGFNDFEITMQYKFDKR